MNAWQSSSRVFSRQEKSRKKRSREEDSAGAAMKNFDKIEIV
jgi:hypothetical protein